MSTATDHAAPRATAVEPSPWIIDLTIDDDAPAEDRAVPAGGARRRLGAALAEARAAAEALGALEVSTRSRDDADVETATREAATTVDPLAPPAATTWEMVVTWS